MSLAFSSGTLFMLLARSLDTARADAFHLACWCASQRCCSLRAATLLFLAGFHLLLRLGTGRVQKQHGLESSAELADLRGPEASVPHHRSRIAVPMAIAHAAGREWHEHVLYADSDLAVCAHMFQEHQVPLRFEHAPDLTQAALRITHRTEDECHDDAIEMLIRERE